MIIGDSIIDAIDWSQDQLRCTRPEAEQALFALMEQQTIIEAEDGFGYPDDEDRDKVIKKLRNAKSQIGTKFRMRVGGHHGSMRMALLQQMKAHGQHLQLKHEMARRERRKRQRLGQSDEAEQMLSATAEADANAIS
jgi:hypothetical protein